MIGSDRVRAIHRAHPAIDLHADTLTWVRYVGYDMMKSHRPPLPLAAYGGHVDLPRLSVGGVGAVLLGLVALPWLTAEPWQVIDEQLDLLDAVTASSPRATKATSAAEMNECKRSDRIALVATIEGAHAIGDSLPRLEHFVRRGVRSLGLVHFSANHVACPAYGTGRDDHQGLTRFGRDVVDACEAMGVLVDLAHVNRMGFMQACAMAKRPKIVSHTGVLGAHRHWRNIDDDQLRAIAGTGGVVGIMFAPRFLGDRTIGTVVRHIRHVIDVAGEDAAAIGSDWDGMIIPTPELCDCSRLPALTDALLDSGLSEQQVIKVMRGNGLRVMPQG